MIVRHALVFSFGFDQVEHGLKLADQDHVVENGFKLVVGEIRPFFLHGFAVLVDRNGLKGQHGWLTHAARIDKL